MKMFMELVAKDPRLLFITKQTDDPRDQLAAVSGSTRFSRDVQFYLNEGKIRANILAFINDNIEFGTNVLTGIQVLTMAVDGGPVYISRRGERQAAKDYVILMTNRKRLPNGLLQYTDKLRREHFNFIGVGFGATSEVDLPTLRRLAQNVVHVPTSTVRSLAEKKDTLVGQHLSRNNCPKRPAMPGKGTASSPSTIQIPACRWSVSYKCHLFQRCRASPNEALDPLP